MGEYEWDIYFEVRQQTQILKEMTEVLKDPEKLRLIGEQARETIPVPWSKVLEIAVERYERLIALGKEGKLKDKRKRML